MMLFPLKSWEPIIVQKNTQTGEVFVDDIHNHYLPETSSEVQSDLVRYVVARETFSLSDNHARSRQVLYASSPPIAKGYNDLQDGNNPKSPFNLYGSKGFRTVKVEDVVFLDNASSALEKKKQQQEKIPTLAKVDFTTTESSGQMTVEKNWVVTIRFQYLGIPDEKEAAWLNWNGFTVTDYRVDQRNI
jgi:type IV secretion system protein VirB8